MDNALLISPKFFGYEYKIKDALSKIGYCVDFYDERLDNSVGLKAMIRLNKFFIRKKIHSSFMQMLKNSKHKNYKIILVVKGETMSNWMMIKIKEFFPKAIVILYLYDSIKNNPNSINLLNKFDKVFSFDNEDCNNYDSMNFLPLFYTNEYKTIGRKNEFEIDALFIGTAHPGRYNILEKIKNQLNGYNLKCYFFMFLSAKILYIYNKVLFGAYKCSKITEFSYSSLTEDQVIDLYKKSRVIIDIQHPDQTGLTMRSFECLGAKRKMITTNFHIKEYDFYNPKNIYILDNNSCEIYKDFFLDDYSNIDKVVYDKYNIDTWIKTIIS
ncbi:MAG: hypothetical protein K8S14_03720 [Actinomycetia bacterium]|nr:hypothetical protein [Actinomycetes bacterium]